MWYCHLCVGYRAEIGVIKLAKNNNRMRYGLRILILMVVAFVAMLPESAYAQLDASALARAQRNGMDTSLGGVNPFANVEGQEGEEQPVDSTLIRRIRKPLESYYFNDSIRALPNFMWNVDRDMNNVNIMPLDTPIR